ncbi:caspase family protein [Crocinitomix sp.]|nr:caspase family protein [Crocinitomix sp.]
MKYHQQGNYVVSAGADNTIVLWDPSSNTIRAELKGHSTAVTSLSINGSGDRLVSISLDGMVKVWDLSSNTLLYTRVQLSRDEWIATSPNGYFDGSPKALNKVNYVKGNQVVNINNLFEKYYVPGLIETIDKSDGKFNNRSQIEDGEMQQLPELSFALQKQGSRSLVDSDSILKSSSEFIDLEVLIAEHDIPLDEIRLYNNGKLILKESLEENVKFRGIGEREHLFKVQLVNGTNEIKALVVNSLRSESNPTILIVEYDGTTSQSDLYIFTIGINEYKNPAYKLDYAVNDAKSFSKSIIKGADSLFNAIHAINILNEDATKENILVRLKEVENQAGPEDVFLFYYAGHGVMSQNEGSTESEFYIVTHDLTNLYDTRENIDKKAISATEIMAISMRVSAEKQLFILDACHSGGGNRNICSAW